MISKKILTFVILLPIISSSSSYAMSVFSKTQDGDKVKHTVSIFDSEESQSQESPNKFSAKKKAAIFSGVVATIILTGGVAAGTTYGVMSQSHPIALRNFSASPGNLSALSAGENFTSDFQSTHLPKDLQSCLFTQDKCKRAEIVRSKANLTLEEQRQYDNTKKGITGKKNCTSACIALWESIPTRERGAPVTGNNLTNEIPSQIFFNESLSPKDGRGPAYNISRGAQNAGDVTPLLQITSLLSTVSSTVQPIIRRIGIPFEVKQSGVTQHTPSKQDEIKENRSHRDANPPKQPKQLNNVKRGR